MSYLIKMLDQYPHSGDIASILGLVVSLIGIGYTAYQARGARTAAEAAKAATTETKDSIRNFETTVDFTVVITALDEIRRMQNNGPYFLLPERCAAVRKLLIEIQSRTPNLERSNKAKFNKAVLHLRTFEELIRGVSQDDIENVVHSSRGTLEILDDLVQVFESLRMSRQEG